MDVSIIVLCQNNERELKDFYEALLQQTSTIGELIVLFTAKADEQCKLIAKRIAEQSPFSMSVYTNDFSNSNEAYRFGLREAQSEIILFADASHQFLPKKVALFKEKFEKDPYLTVMFHNAQVTNRQNEIVIHDYFGKTGFYERWDYYKDLPTVLSKQAGLLQPFQVGISQKASRLILQFLNEYPTFQLNLNIADFVLIFFGMKDQQTIREIPYVLTSYKQSQEKIQSIFKNGNKLDLSIHKHLQWLKDYKAVATLIQRDHKIIDKIERNIQQLTERKQLVESKNKFMLFIQYLFGNYKAVSPQPFTDFLRELNNKEPK